MLMEYNRNYQYANHGDEVDSKKYQNIFRRMGYFSLDGLVPDQNWAEY
jgi:hypothetical protein